LQQIVSLSALNRFDLLFIKPEIANASPEIVVQHATHVASLMA